MTITTPATIKQDLPKIRKVPTIIITIQAMLDQFGLLEKYQKEYGDIFYTPKSSLYPPYVIFSDPQGIEQVFTADPSYFEISPQTTAPIRVLLGDYSLVV